MMTSIYQEGTDISKPNHTVRLEDRKIEVLKNLTGEDKKAAAIRKAVDTMIELGDSMIKVSGSVSSVSSVSSASGTELRTTKFVAEILGISVRAVRDKIRKGQLVAYKPGRDWLIDMDSVIPLLKPNVEKLDDHQKGNGK